VIKITNYELGIVFPLKDEDEANRAACFERPPRKYTGNDEPWVRNTFSLLFFSSSFATDPRGVKRSCNYERDT